MRQVFSSARLENVEQVAKLLEDAGIEVRITDGRSFKKGIRGDFSYRSKPGERVPAVWVIRSEDQPRARAMLREAGLMDSSRNAPGSYRAMSFRGDIPDPHADAGRRRALRIKLALLVVVAAVVALAFMQYRAVPTAQPGAATAAAAGTAAATQLAATPADLPAAGTAATPESLALALLRSELPTRAGDIACLAVDGADASPALLAALPESPGTVLPLSRCPAGAAAGASAPRIIAIGKYVADDAGTGTIFINRRRVGGRGVSQWYNVRREGEGWRIIQPL